MGVSNGNSYNISIAAKLSTNVKTDLQAQLNQIKGLTIDVDVKSDQLKTFINSLAEIQKYKKLELDFSTQESIASARSFGEKIGATAASSLKSNLEKALETTQIFSELQQNLEKSNTAIGRVVNSYATKIDQARTNLGYTSGITGDLALNLRMLRKVLAEFKKSNGLDDLRETLQNVSPLAGSLRTMFDGEKGALKELNNEYSRHVTLVEAAVNAEKGKGDTAQKLPEALKAEAEAIAQANKAVASTVVNSSPSSSSSSSSAPRKEPGESDERYYLRLRKAQISEGNKQYKQELSGNTAKVNAYEKLNKYIDNEIASLSLTQEKKKELEKTLELDKKKSGLNRSLARLDNDANSRKDTESQYLALSRQKLKNSVNIAKSSGDGLLKKIYENYDKELDKRIAALSPSRDIRRSVNKTLLPERTRTNAQLQQIQSNQTSAQSAVYQKQYIDNYKKIIALKKQLDTLDSSEVEKKKVLNSEIGKLNASNKELIGNGSVKRNDVSAQTKKIDNEYKSSKAIRNASVVDSANNAKSTARQKQYIDNYKKIIAKKKELLSVDSTETNKTKLLETEIKRLESANDKLINKYGVKKQSVSSVTKALDREYSDYLKLRNAQNADTNVSNAQSFYLQKYEEWQKNLLLASKNKNNSSLANIYKERATDLEKELKELQEGREYSKYKNTDSFKGSRDEIDHRYRQLSEIQGQQNARSANNQTIAYDKLSNRLTEYFNKYQAGISSSVPLTQKFNILLNKLNNREFNSIGEAQNEFARFRIACRDAGVEVDDFYSKLKRRVGTILKTSLIQGGLYKITNQAQQMLQSVIELDSAMTELRKVTTATEDEYSSFLVDANTRARELGATLVETVNSTADFARLGYGIDDASTLSNAALVYSNVGDDIDSIDDATQSIISTMQAYGYEVDDVMSIVDKFNEVGKQIA